MSGRKIAYNILRDIELNKNYSNLSINAHLNSRELSQSDKGFATEMVYGVIENRILIDYLINKVSKIKVKKMSNPVKIVLRMGAYQILFLDGVKNYAAINESVNMIKKFDSRSTGFVNAVLRNISRSGMDLCDLKKNSSENLSIIFSYEKWIIDRFIQQYGMDETIEILESLSEKPRLFARINRLKMSEFSTFEELKKFVLKNLREEGLEVSESSVLEEAIEIKGFKSIENNKMFRKGYISIQDISSMMVARTMNPSENSKVLDVCAAPGGKSTHIAELMNGTGKVISQEIYPHKIKLIDGYKNRLGIKNLEAVQGDATEENAEYLDSFDYVLCDVPCSGMGIVRRKPEIKYKKEEEVKELSLLQLKILENSSKYVKKGGVIVYSTCTLFNDENMGVVDSFLGKTKNFVLESIDISTFYSDTKDKGFINILPNKDKMDGFFICKMKKI